MDNTLVLIFLGNPGREYALTRHNVAWMAAESLCDRLSRNTDLKIVPSGPPVWSGRFDGSLASLSLGNRKLLLFKPETFMNLSGQAVRKLVDFYKLEAQSVLAVHDDLELAYGQIAFRTGGGAGGHNGLRSLDTHLGTANYGRCRIGIGRPVHGTVADFVLSRFTPDEATVLPLVLDAVSTALADMLAGGKTPQGKIQAFQAS